MQDIDPTKRTDIKAEFEDYAQKVWPEIDLTISQRGFHDNGDPLFGYRNTNSLWFWRGFVGGFEA